MVLLPSLLLSAHAEEPLRVVTEELPPYSMLRDGKVTGMSTEGRAPMTSLCTPKMC
jgi:polar amino acid transport system substrate-binding protein